MMTGSWMGMILASSQTNSCWPRIRPVPNIRNRRPLRHSRRLRCVWEQIRFTDSTFSRAVLSMTDRTVDPPRFACDAMCGGLARWLRALGYDATFSASIDDGQLVEQSRRDGGILISSDG